MNGLATQAEPVPGITAARGTAGDSVLAPRADFFPHFFWLWGWLFHLWCWKEVSGFGEEQPGSAVRHMLLSLCPKPRPTLGMPQLWYQPGVPARGWDLRLVPLLW